MEYAQQIRNYYRMEGNVLVNVILIILFKTMTVSADVQARCL